MVMRMMGLLVVVGARLCGSATQRGAAAAGWLRVTTTALLPLAVFQQRHL